MIKKLLRKLIYGSKSNSHTYVKYLRSLGMKIGEGTVIYEPMKTFIDTTRPWMIDIGDNVKITEGVTILTHGYDWSVLKGVYGDVLGSAGAVVIGDNIFIGMKTTILKGVHIGNNVIIGANSLVNKDIPDNVVVAGNPCRVIMTLDEYYKKRKSVQLQEAEELVRMYRKRYHRDPDEKVLHEFFWLFCDGETVLPQCWENMMKLNVNYDLSLRRLKDNKKLFVTMNEFLESVK